MKSLRLVFCMAIVLPFCVLFAAVPASASTVYLDAFLDGLQATPPDASPGTGYGTMTYDTVSLLLSWSIDYSGLTAPAVAAHFHKAPPGVPGPVQVPIGGVAGTSGTAIGSATLTAPQAADLLAHNWYVNIHTSTFPGGEIRGQVVPEPSTLVLAGLAAASLSFVAWRRRRARR